MAAPIVVNELKHFYRPEVQDATRFAGMLPSLDPIKEWFGESDNTEFGCNVCLRWPHDYDYPVYYHYASSMPAVVPLEAADTLVELADVQRCWSAAQYALEPIEQPSRYRIKQMKSQHATCWRFPDGWEVYTYLHHACQSAPSTQQKESRYWVRVLVRSPEYASDNEDTDTEADTDGQN